jgi:hypothetical protein
VLLNVRSVDAMDHSTSEGCMHAMTSRRRLLGRLAWNALAANLCCTQAMRQRDIQRIKQRQLEAPHKAVLLLVVR